MRSSLRSMGCPMSEPHVVSESSALVFDRENIEKHTQRFWDERAARALAEEKRDARLRLTCAALTGILAGDVSVPGGAIPHDKVASWAVGLAGETLALLYPEAEGKEKERG